MTYSVDIADFTTAVETDSDVTGTGAFDVMMNSIRANVYEEYREGRITGAEYAQVYLSAMNSAADRALNFVLSKDKAALEADNLVLQGELISKQVVKAQKEIDVIAQDLIDKTAIATQSTERVTAEILVLTDTACKLKAEFDVLVQQRLKLIEETSLLSQKIATEKAQTDASQAVGADTVVGKQKTLYQAQADGFARDAEQKAAKIMVDTWNVRRTTDSDNTPGSPAGLDDTDIFSVVGKLKTGIGA